MSKPKVLVTRKWPAEVEAELKEKYDVTLNENDVALTIPELQEAFQNYDCVCPTVTDPINEEVLSIPNKKAKSVRAFKKLLSVFDDFNSVTIYGRAFLPMR